MSTDAKIQDVIALARTGDDDARHKVTLLGRTLK
jgi:hypothetical protein